MSEGDSSSEVTGRLVPMMQDVCRAQDNASLLLKELRGKCKQHGMDADFLKVQAAFLEAEMVSAQSLAVLKKVDAPVARPTQAIREYLDDHMTGDLEEKARARLERAERAWQPDFKIKQANDHSFEDART